MLKRARVLWLLGVLKVTRKTIYCTCNVILRRVRVTIVDMEKQTILHILRACL